MSVFTRSADAYVIGAGGGFLQVIDAAVTLDEGWAPYAQGNVVIKRPSATVLRLLDPAVSSLVVLTIRSSLGGDREFRLRVRAMQELHRAGTIGLSLASDEARLQDYAHVGLTPDSSPRNVQQSVRNVVQYVMNKALGTTDIVEFNDFDFTTYSSAKNLWPFVGRSGGPATGWGVNAIISQGNQVFNVIPLNESVDSFASVDVSMSPGKTYTAFAVIGQQYGPQQGALSSRARRIVITSVTAGVERIIAMSPQKANGNGTQRLSVTFTIPSNAKESTVRLYNGAANNGAQAQQVYFRDAMVIEGDGIGPSNYVEPYFDGDSPATAAYTYSWDGEPYMSSSSRTPRINRSPEVLLWSPGQTAWDFLRPIVEAAGLRLWCDEQQRWHLTTATYSVPGTIEAHAGSNLYDASTLTSRTATQSDGTPLYVDAVLVRYTWVDQLGNDRERYDVATTPGYSRPHLVERPETPFPGTGAATYLLRRYLLRRRQVPVTAALDTRATPGMAVSIRAGDGGTYLGYLDSVTFDMGSDDMSIGSKDLTLTTNA